MDLLALRVLGEVGLLVENALWHSMLVSFCNGAPALRVCRNAVAAVQVVVHIFEYVFDKLVVEIVIVTLYGHYEIIKIYL